jgi:hypothetical protein
MEAKGDDVDLSGMKMYPCVVPDQHVSQQTMDAALEILNRIVERNRAAKKRPWWKFW